MKISYAQAFQAAPALNTLANRPYGAALALKLVDIIDQLNPHLLAIERFRDNLFSADTEGQLIEDLNQKFADYLNTTTADITFIPLYTDEADAAGLAFTVREMSAVRFLFALRSPTPKQ